LLTKRARVPSTLARGAETYSWVSDTCELTRRTFESTNTVFVAIVDDRIRGIECFSWVFAAVFAIWTKVDKRTFTCVRVLFRNTFAAVKTGLRLANGRFMLAPCAVVSSLTLASELVAVVSALAAVFARVLSAGPFCHRRRRDIVQALRVATRLESSILVPFVPRLFNLLGTYLA